MQRHALCNGGAYNVLGEGGGGGGGGGAGGAHKRKRSGF